jgi:hypothetical protein
MKNHKKENKKLGKIQNGLYYLEGGLIRIIKYSRRDTKLKSRNPHIRHYFMHHNHKNEKS